LSAVKDRAESALSSAGEQRSSSGDEGDEYSKCAKHEELPLLHGTPPDPPVAISGDVERLESLLSGASAADDDDPQSVLLAGHDVEIPLSLHADEDNDDDDDGSDDHDDEDVDGRQQQQADESDEEGYRAAAAEVSSAAAILPDDSAAGMPSNFYSVAAVSEPAASDSPVSGSDSSSSSSSSGGRYWRAQLVPDSGADSAATSGMEDGQSLRGDADESVATADGSSSPESDSGYCSVKFFANAVGDQLPD